MVLLTSLINAPGKATWGQTEEGEDIMLEGVPHPNAIGVYGGPAEVKKEYNRIIDLARADDSKYYIIQDVDECLKNRSNHLNVHSMSYITFVK